MRIGVDLVAVERLQRAVEGTRSFAGKVFTAGERELAGGYPPHRAAEFLAGRFAVKEAVLKALGAGITGGVSLLDIETLSAESGAPELHLAGSALAAAQGLGLSRWEVSISHDGGTAVAFVVLT